LSGLYYEDDYVSLYHGDARDFQFGDGLVVSDPPFNIGFGYRTFTDRMPEQDYLDMMAHVFNGPSVLIHYPETSFRIAARMGQTPTEVVSWVYNSNGAHQWRAISWFGIKPDLSLVKQPYKNPKDIRVSALIAQGKAPSVYDWWHIDPVKNVSGEKTEHPCQMPLEVMERILITTPSELVIDPFAGSGTTLRAAKNLRRRAMGVEMDERYCEIIATRLSQDVLPIAF
jgi:site-specific DNA-methyltransferase (adenine-specific)